MLPQFFIAEMENRQRNGTFYFISGITTIRKGTVIQRHYLFTIVHKGKKKKIHPRRKMILI